MRAGNNSNNGNSGPAVQRLLVVGHSMAGKRSFIDRLRRAAEASSSASAAAAASTAAASPSAAAGGASRARKAASAEERRAELSSGAAIPKTVAASTHGSGLHYTAIAYHNAGAELLESSAFSDLCAAAAASSSDSDDARMESVAKSVAGAMGSAANASALSLLAPAASAASYYHAEARAKNATTSSSSGGANSGQHSYLLALNNTVLEAIACDVAEGLAAALPTYEALQYTAVVILIDATDVANAASTVHHWVTAINNRVRTLSLAASNANNNNTAASASASSLGGGGGASKSAAAIADVRPLQSGRSAEIAAAKAALSATGLRADMAPSFGSLQQQQQGAAMSVPPESFRTLLPSMLVLAKADLLEDSCRSGGAVATGGGAASSTAAAAAAAVSDASSARHFTVAIHHARWLALQRGSAFAAVSTKSTSGGAGGAGGGDIFGALWAYVAYSLLPGTFETAEYLRLQRAQLRQRAAGGGGAAADEAADDAASQRDLAAIEARRRRRQQRRAQEEGDAEASGASEDEEAEGGGADEGAKKSRKKTTAGDGDGDSDGDAYLDGDDGGEAHHRRQLFLEALAAAVLLDPSVRPCLSAAPSQAMLIPRGADDTAHLSSEFASPSYIRNHFSTIATTTASDVHRAVAAAAAAASGPNAIGKGAPTGDVDIGAVASQAPVLTAAEVSRGHYDTFAKLMAEKLAAATSAKLAAAASAAAAIGGGQPISASAAYGVGPASASSNAAAVAASGVSPSSPTGIASAAADGSAAAGGAETSLGSAAAAGDDDDEAMIWDE